MGHIYQERELAPLGSLYSDFQIALAHSFLKLFTNSFLQKCRELPIEKIFLVILVDFNEHRQNVQNLSFCWFIKTAISHLFLKLHNNFFGQSCREMPV